MKRLALLLLVLFAVSACTARAQVHVLFDSDSSGVVRMVAAADSQMREAMTAELEGAADWDDPDFVLEMFEMQDMAGDGFDVARYEDGDFVGVEASRRFESMEELEEILGDQESGIDFTTEGRTITMTAPGFVEDPGADGGMGLGGFLTIELGLQVKLPGKVTTHNATRVAEDGTLVWEYEFDGDDDTFPDPEATATVSTGLSTLWIIVGVVVLAVLVLGGLLLWRRYRSVPVSEPADTAAPEPVTVEPEE